MDILVTGTGRCGTGYISQVLSSVGVKCTHEGLFNLEGYSAAVERIEQRLNNPDWGWRAESSWLAAPFLKQLEPYQFKTVHLVRHPKKVIDSYLRLLLYSKPGAYYDWMIRYLPELEDYTDPVQKAACWYVRVNQMIEPFADYRHKVENDVTELLDWLQIDWQGKEIFSNTRYNTRPGYGMSDVMIQDVDEPLRSELLQMSRRYGYEWPDLPSTIQANWLDGQKVTINKPSAHIGGAWQLRDADNVPTCYDAPLVSFFLKQIKKVGSPIIVDIGANTGNFALLPLLHPGATVHAFEPNPVAFKALRNNVEINGLQSQVKLYQVGLSNYDGPCELKVPVQPLHAAVACLGSGIPRDRGFTWREILIQVKRLDSYNLKPDFIKIDVEGAELEVLVGARETIQRCRPKILTEYTSLNTMQFGYEREEIVAFLRGLGYTKFRPVGLEDLWIEP